MIPAQPGTIASYSEGDHDFDRPVIAWDDAGEPLVYSPYKNKLVPANEYPEFCRVEVPGRADGASTDTTEVQVITCAIYQHITMLEGDLVRAHQAGKQIPAIVAGLAAAELRKVLAQTIGPSWLGLAVSGDEVPQ
ncbi:hypothetical protein [Nonomuraea sp. NPDC049480]|uniref:hypothetical protein n=1 Tax=Nonomuraea sp. NPDC049480 TaxID=3364353 RepID=UPI00378E7B6A